MGRQSLAFNHSQTMQSTPEDIIMDLPVPAKLRSIKTLFLAVDSMMGIVRFVLFPL